ncbi:hypothetical protein ColTof4_04503 [Colletotrichum tofieldiae]|nr:hypothetical protein ColTof3_11288 [Colletotrichum tofieldiae]GKT72080.1 hypothetical protein ColTof4_04503 [Colletotrichum tofieldiae]GKT90131.1 hypothetical protein Ct61P_07981 [Colletotrichum tofieldiae]
MANLLSASDISALYITRSKQLVLDAKVPGFVLGPKFERVKGFVGGLRFALVGFPGGFGRQPESQTVTDKVHISLPAPHFNNETVLIDTAEGLQIIKIKYTGLKGEALAAGLNFVTQQEKSGSTGTIASDVLPPINSYLPGDSVLPISALIPKADGDSKVSVDISFNEEFLRLVNASAHDGTINWSFKWAKIPTEEGQNPQLINVNTTIWNGIVGPLAKTSLNVQGYIVHFVELQK